MEIRIQEKIATKGGGVVIDTNIRKESEKLDKNGNVIDPRTKEIIRSVNEK